MPEQLSFAGFEAAPLPTESVFIAIFPDAAAAACITQLAQGLHDRQRVEGQAPGG